MKSSINFKIVIIGEHFIGRNCLVKRLFEGIFSHHHPFTLHTEMEIYFYDKLIDRIFTHFSILSCYSGRPSSFNNSLFSLLFNN